MFKVNNKNTKTASKLERIEHTSYFIKTNKNEKDASNTESFDLMCYTKSV